MPPTERGTRLAALLFTDIVGSTALADELGDRRWRELLARHHEIVRRALRRFNGREIDSAGDGFFAAFDKPADAVRCAAAMAGEVQALGIEIRAGLHVGEAEVFGTKLSGVTVHIAARTMAGAGTREILVTRVLRDLVPGSGFRFEDRGSHAFKGLPGEWQLFALTSADGQPRPAPLRPEEQRDRLAAIQPPGLARRARIPVLAGAAALVVTAVIVTAVLGPGRGSKAPTNGTPAARGEGPSGHHRSEHPPDDDRAARCHSQPPCVRGGICLDR